MLTFGAIARTRLASGRLVTKKILQPDLDNAPAIGSMPQPRDFVYMLGSATVAWPPRIARAAAGYAPLGSSTANYLMDTL
jgi:hypothetical protein